MENQFKLIKVKVVALIRILEKALITFNQIAKYGIHPFFDLFDCCNYFLVRFKAYIDPGMFTDMLYQMLRKNSQKKSENLLYAYREHIQENLGELTSGHLTKVLYILSRSPFPF